MKLYYTPGACSLAPHIVLNELGLAFERERVDLRSGKLDDGSSFRDINPKGYVPVLRLDDGSLLTEGPAVVQYLADLKPASGLAPAAGTLPRYHLQEWLNFIATELHKQYTAFFHPKSTDGWKQVAMEMIRLRLGLLQDTLQRQDYLMGQSFTVADAYLFTVLSWSSHIGLDLSAWPAVQKYLRRIAERPSVKQAIQAEGITIQV